MNLQSVEASIALVVLTPNLGKEVSTWLSPPETIARVRPVDLFRTLDRRTPQQWGDFPLAFVWLAQTLSPAATLAGRFADARRWLRTLAPTRRLANTYQPASGALIEKAQGLTSPAA